MVLSLREGILRCLQESEVIMKKILITGANSYVGANVEKWLKRTPEEFEVDTVATFNNEWKKAILQNMMLYSMSQELPMWMQRRIWSHYIEK